MHIPTFEADRVPNLIAWGISAAMPLTLAFGLAGSEGPASAAEPSAGTAVVETSAAPGATDPITSETIETNELGAALPAAAKQPPGRSLGTGSASFYGQDFAGRRTASGERFDPRVLTAAHRTLPFGSRVRVTNQHNGKSVVVRINDRGPFHGDRVIDLSLSAAQEIGIVLKGRGRVELALLSD